MSPPWGRLETICSAVKGNEMTELEGGEGS